jgi:hypothetical protein
MTNRALSWLLERNPLTLSTRPKNRTSVEVSIHKSVPSLYNGPARLCTVSAIPRSEGDKWAGNGRARFPKKSFPALDAAQKPYHSVSRNPHVSAVLTTALLGLAPARSTRASAANHREGISACRMMTRVIANRNVTVTDHACPQHSCDPRGCLRRAEINA